MGVHGTCIPTAYMAHVDAQLHDDMMYVPQDIPPQDILCRTSSGCPLYMTCSMSCSPPPPGGVCNTGCAGTVYMHGMVCHSCHDTYAMCHALLYDGMYMLSANRVTPSTGHPGEGGTVSTPAGVMLWMQVHHGMAYLHSGMMPSGGDIGHMAHV